MRAVIIKYRSPGTGEQLGACTALSGDLRLITAPMLGCLHSPTTPAAWDLKPLACVYCTQIIKDLNLRKE